MPKTLLVLADYRNGALAIDLHPGQVQEFDDERAAFLLRDAPGCFEVAAAPSLPDPAIESPPAASATGEIDVTDAGDRIADDAEARLAGQALQARQAQAAGSTRSFNVTGAGKKGKP